MFSCPLSFSPSLCPGLSSATPSMAVSLCLRPASFPLAPLGHYPLGLLDLTLLLQNPAV